MKTTRAPFAKSDHGITTLLLSITLSFAAAHGAHSATPLWEFQGAGKIIGKPTVTGDTIYFAGGDTVYAIDFDGQERWQHTVGGQVAAAVRVHAGTVYVHSSAGLHALAGNGTPRWTYEAEDLGPLVDGRTWGWGADILADPWGLYRSAPLLVGDAVVFGSSDGVHAVSRDTGEGLWRVPVGPVTADPAVHEDLVIVGSWNHSVYALEAETGKVSWRFRASLPDSKGVDWVGYQGFHLNPIVDGGRVFVGNRNTYFYALDADDGTIAWNSKVGASWIGSPAVITDRHVFYGLSDGQAILGHRKDSGALSHFYRTGSLVFAQPALHTDQLIVGTYTGHLIAIDTTSGQGRDLTHFGPAERRYAEFFDPASLPEGLTPYEANRHGIERMLTESNSILGLEVEAGRVYVGTASGVLFAVELEPSD